MRRTFSFLALLLWGAIPAATCRAEQTNASATNSLVLEGLVTPMRQFELASPSEGLVTEIKRREGDKIGAGDALAELSSEQEAIILRQMELQSRKQSEDLGSMKRLYEEKAVSRDEYTKTMLAAEQAAAERDLAAIRLKERTIVAPEAGLVLRLLKEEGESIRKLETFAELASIDQLNITVYVPAAYLGRIARGDKVSVRPKSGAAPVEGSVELADPVLDPGGEVFRVKILVPEPAGRLQAGTRADVAFNPAAK